MLNIQNKMFNIQVINKKSELEKHIRSLLTENEFYISKGSVNFIILECDEENQHEQIISCSAYIKNNVLRVSEQNGDEIGDFNNFIFDSEYAQFIVFELIK